MTDFLNYYNLLPTELSIAVIIFNLFASLVLQVVIVYIYKKTRHGLSYSESFVFTLIMIGVVGTSIMMIVQNNIVGAFALLGAFSLIRFRTILKESSDIAFVLFSLSTGVAIGTNHYALAIVTVIFLGGMIYFMQRFGFGRVGDNFDYLLVIKAESQFSPATLDGLFNEHTRRREMLHTKQHGQAGIDLAYTLKLKSTEDLETVTTKLRGISGIKNFELLTGKNTAEY